MTKRWICAFLFSFAAGCATVQPYRTSRPLATSSADQAYDCAFRRVNFLGYTVAEAKKPSGFFKAERSWIAGASSIHWGEQMAEEITVLVLPGDPPVLQVTAAAGSGRGNHNAKLVESSKEGVEAANSIVTTCAK